MGPVEQAEQILSAQLSEVGLVSLWMEVPGLLREQQRQQEYDCL
jgi:hypothetical protein